jgi:hypothetical protein
MSASSTQPSAPATLEAPDPDRFPDFVLDDINGKSFALRDLRKLRPVVVVFGSYTSPSFRQRAAALNRLAREMTGRVNVAVVYTREAHPVGDWEVERNRDEAIRVEAHADANARRAAARAAVKALDLDPPVLLDTIEDATFIAFGRHPNGAALIDRDGATRFKQVWFEPHAMTRAIEALLDRRPRRP